MAPDTALADAIVADINDSTRSWSRPFVAERSWVPVWLGEQELTPGRLVCLVNPWPEIESRPLSRDQAEFDFEVDFGFAERLQDQYRGTIDDLRDLVHSAVARYTKTNFTVAGVGQFIALRQTSVYAAFDPQQLTRTISEDNGELRYTGDFMSVFRVPYRFLEAT